MQLMNLIYFLRAFALSILLIIASVPAQSDWINLTGAETSANIAEIYVLDDHATLTLVKASPDAYQQLAQANILDGHEAWAPMAIASGRLILRDLKKMVCIDAGKP